jgi:hypothetical protein
MDPINFSSELAFEEGVVIIFNSCIIVAPTMSNNFLQHWKTWCEMRVYVHVGQKAGRDQYAIRRHRAVHELIYNTATFSNILRAWKHGLSFFYIHILINYFISLIILTFNVMSTYCY